jgi:hypothetical protein
VPIIRADGLASGAGLDHAGIPLLERAHATAEILELRCTEIRHNFIHGRVQGLALQRNRQELLDDLNFLALADGFFKTAGIFVLAGRNFALGNHGFEHPSYIRIRAAFTCPSPAGTHVPVAHGAIDQAQRRKTNARLALLNL